MKKMSADRLHLVLIEFSPKAYRVLRGLKRAIGATTNADTIREGLSALKSVTTELKRKRRILSEGKRNVKELIFPFVVRSTKRNAKPKGRPA